MGSVVVGVIGTLLGVLIGVVAQQAQAKRSHRWQREDVLNSQRWQREDVLGSAKRAVYAEYLRSISASYAQAISGQRTRTEDAHLLAATAELEILSGPEVAEPARDLVDTVMKVHERIATGSGVPKAEVDAVDRRRLEIVDLFKADLGLPTRASTAHGSGRSRP
ncbi:hypothetical protein ACWCQL_25195 [Streptomyces sp. NPDC002073]|uniref:hypothetical protein n=1 Tax=Streptomyces sp. NBC_00239 TaxID=2903640 RepID=UPI002E282499|nr:hypothetical protein [Streptomyces sp. NBC_00239]